MNGQMLIPAVAFVGVLAAVLLVSTLAGRRSAKTRRRLEEHEVPVFVNDAKPFEKVNVLKEQNYSSIGFVNAILRRFKPARTAAGELLRANVSLTVPQYLLARALLAGILFYAIRAATGNTIFALPAIPVGLMLPRIALIVRASRRRKAFEGQLAEAIDVLVGALRAGYGVLQAIESTSKEMGNPMSEELLRVVDQVNIGTSPVDALQELTQRIDSYDLSMFVTAVTVQRAVGGNLAEVLENIAETVRERQRVRGEVQALTTGPRVSSYILGLFPFAMLLYLVTTNALYRQTFFYETIGRIMLVFSAVWSLIGFFLSKSVSKVEY
jgi:tight adherence protein B